jgi:2-polyprenyl-3-methyl-5-hydroxy-6-metoxy-1,4-benzoquinol methylase
MQPAKIVWADPANGTPPDLKAMPCPNCGSDAAKSLILTFDGQHGKLLMQPLKVLRCPTCTCHFYDNQSPPDYTDPEMNDYGRVPFYVQQGAGIGLITRPLAQAAAPPGSSYMEVGCGYGFGLDFAIHSRGWNGVGIDPAPLASVGREALNVSIELRYLRDDDEARGTIDVVMASEVIEHIPSPVAFIRTLRAMLRPGGLMMLTTPNGDDIVPATSPGIIVSLLSPMLHLVIQSSASLTALLHQAGFAHADVQVDGHSLVAFASDAPLVLEQDQITLRRSYRAHLAHRAKAFDASSDVFLGYAGRLFLESVNDNDMDAAAHAWSLLVPACRDRFGFDLDRLEELPPPIATCDLEEMARLVPLNLGGLLYARGIQRLKEGIARPALEKQFTLAIEAAAAMRRALNAWGMEDGQTEDIGWTASAEALLCAAAAGAMDIAARLAALPRAPAGGAARRRAVLGRAVGTLVNAGHYGLTREVVQSEGFGIPAGDAPLDDGERDLMFSLAVLEVQTGPDGRAGDRAAARRGFMRVRDAVAPGSDLWRAALRGEMLAIDLAPAMGDVEAMTSAVLSVHPDPEVARWAFPKLVNAGRYDAARRVAQSGALTEPMAGQPLAEQDRDVVFCLAVLDVQSKPQPPGVEDLAAARLRFARVRDATAPGLPLWWAAFHGELQAVELAGDQPGVATLIASVVKSHPDVRMGYPEMMRLVSAGELDAAREVVRRSKLEAGFAQPGSALPLDANERDRLFFLAVLDAQIGPDGRAVGEPAVGRSRFARVRAATPPGSDLWWAALRGELQSLDLLGAQDEAAALTAEIAATHPGLLLPDDIAARIAPADADARRA